MSETPKDKTLESPPAGESPISKVKTVLGSWKVKAGLLATAVVFIAVGVFLLTFFWSHIIAGMGMKSWSSRADAQPIECMIKDTNSDGYVSCTAMLKGEVVPLECGASIFNLGCRVNYGSAASPPVRPSAPLAN
jgi:hypothetical protein